MKKKGVYKTTLLFSATCLILLADLFIVSGKAGANPELSDGESVYVPIYSNVYSGPSKKFFPLGPMLSIRNTDPEYAITILRADYYNDKGDLAHRYIREPIELAPLASHHFYIEEYDKKGGSGANFIVQWKSEKKINQPIIQGIMLGMKAGQGVSFVCPGQVLIEHSD
ncbi:MAG: DUF3124 domain-containing protein [Thermodesulfobacteriota bacterium]